MYFIISIRAIAVIAEAIATLDLTAYGKHELDHKLPSLIKANIESDISHKLRYILIYY